MAGERWSRNPRCHDRAVTPPLRRPITAHSLVDVPFTDLSGQGCDPPSDTLRKLLLPPLTLFPAFTAADHIHSTPPNTRETGKDTERLPVIGENPRSQAFRSRSPS